MHKDLLLSAYLSQTLDQGSRIEIRGFLYAGAIRESVETQAVEVPDGHVLHFKPGLELRDRVNQSRYQYPAIKDN
jgi:integration host factor subunit beta